MNKISPGIFNVIFSTPNLSTRMLMLHLQFVFAVLSLLVMCGQFYFVVTHPPHCICLCLITMSSTGQPVPRSLDSLVSSLLLGSWDLNRTTTVTVWDNVSYFLLVTDQAQSLNTWPDTTWAWFSWPTWSISNLVLCRKFLSLLQNAWLDAFQQISM